MSFARPGEMRPHPGWCTTNRLSGLLMQTSESRLMTISDRASQRLEGSAPTLTRVEREPSGRHWSLIIHQLSLLSLIYGAPNSKMCFSGAHIQRDCCLLSMGFKRRSGRSSCLDHSSLASPLSVDRPKERTTTSLSYDAETVT